MSKREALEILNERYTQIRKERDSMPYCDTMQDRVIAMSTLIQKVMRAKGPELAELVDQYGIDA
jgi:hypothetical protein